MTEPDARARDNNAGRVAAGERKVGPASAGPTEERIVVRDKRKINPANQAKATGTNAAKDGAAPTGAPADADAQVVEGEVVDAGSATMPGDAGSAENVGLVDDGTPAAGEGATPTAGDQGVAISDEADESAPVAADSGDAEVIADAMRTDMAGVLGAELEALRRDVDELTRDLQRVSAEYANYRKRVDRDRGVVTEQATGAVLVALLPVLDDLDRAREHGDLVGPFGSVAEQLTQTLSKFGLTPIGEKGDPFDPTRHEAVAHQTSTEVTEPTCVDVLRRGYTLGERLLRPALVAVAEPE